MKKYLTIALILVLPFFLTACSLIKKTDTKSLSENGKTESQDKDSKQESKEKTSDEQSFNGTLLDLIKLNKAMKCTYKFESSEGNADEDMKQTGTVYVNGKKTKAEVELSYQGKNIKSYMISDGDYSYIWTSENPNIGIKIKVDPAEMENSNKDLVAAGSDNASYKDLSKKMDFKCLPWIVDESVFTAPSSVQFSDMSKLFESLGKQDQAQE